MKLYVEGGGSIGLLQKKRLYRFLHNLSLSCHSRNFTGVVFSKASPEICYKTLKSFPNKAYTNKALLLNKSNY